uniref:SLC12 domain-containing protein n=1 Tax=Angiostrongylus cantonensis TaxID=6313 RepID=A0A0K0DKR0_ANGCA
MNIVIAVDENAHAAGSSTVACSEKQFFSSVIDGVDWLAWSRLAQAGDVVWRGCTLRVFAIGDSDITKNEDIRKGLQKYIYMLRIDAKIFMVNLLDMEVSDEVVEKTAELEKRQQTIKNDIRVSFKSIVLQ